MKRNLSVLSVATLVILIASCSSKDEKSQNTGQSECSALLDSVKTKSADSALEQEDPGVKAIQFTYSSTPVDGKHNIDVDFRYKNGKIVSGVLSVMKYKQNIDGSFTMSSVQDFNLIDVPYGFLISLTKSGSDTILNIDSATKKYQAMMNINLSESKAKPGYSDAQIRLIRKYSWKHSDVVKYPSYSTQGSPCIVGMDDARSAGYAGSDSEPSVMKCVHLGKLAYNIQVRYESAGSGYLDIGAGNSNRVRSTYYDDEPTNASPQVKWGWN